MRPRGAVQLARNARLLGTGGGDMPVRALHDHHLSAIARLLACALVLTALSGCSAAPKIDRTDPEVVLRAYFDAWRRSDWSEQASFMDRKYAHAIPEPVSDLRLLSVERAGAPSKDTVLYAVAFRIRVKGQGASMSSGRCDWTYELKWDPGRESWIITNYGAG